MALFTTVIVSIYCDHVHFCQLITIDECCIACYMCISSSTIVTFLYTCHTDRQLLGCTANSVVAYRPMCSLDHNEHNEHNERLNPSKTVMIWLGSKYQVDRVGVHAVPVLTSTVPIVDSARAWCRSRQPFDHGGTCWLCMPISVLPTSAVAPSHEVTVA